MRKAIILSAGRGERMRPLTDTTPKPLVIVKNKPLIVHQIEKLAAAGITEIIINISYLADKIKNTLGDGKQFNVKLTYSYEPMALETAGGIIQALPLLGNEPFLVLSSDVYTDFPYEILLTQHLPSEVLAFLILVPNPPYHPKGDYTLGQDGFLTAEPRYNYAGIGLYHPAFFDGCRPGKSPLGPLINQKIIEKHVKGELYQGVWYNAGTMDELQKIEGS